MDSEESDIDVTELDDCLKELEAIDISDLELSDNEEDLDAEKSPVHDEGVTEEAESKPLETSMVKSFLPSCEVERNAEFKLEETAKINYPSHCTELGENYDIRKQNETEESKPLAFQTDLSVTVLRQILQTTIEKGILENKTKSEIPVDIPSTTTVVKDSGKLSSEIKRDETKQLIPTLVQHINQVEPLSSPETTFTQKISPNLESIPKTKCHKVREEDDSSRLDDTAVKVGTILKQEVLDPIPDGSEAVLSENESPAVLKRALSQASLSSCETVIFERRSPVNEQRLCRRPSSDVGDVEEDRRPSSDIGYIEEDRRPSSDIGYIEEDRRPSSDIGYTKEDRRPSSDIGDIEEDQRPSSDIADIEEVILVKSILQNLEALEACDSLEAISPDSMSSPPPIERLDKAVSAELSENDIDYKKERRKKRRKKKRTRRRHDRKKKGDNEKDGLSDASSVSSDDFPEPEKKPPRSLDYLAHCKTKMRSPSHKTHDRRSPSSSPHRPLPFAPLRKLKRHSPHGSEPQKYKPHDVHYVRKLRRDDSSSSPSPSRSRRSSYKKLHSAVKKPSAATSRSPTHSPPHRSLHSRYIGKRHDSLRSRSKSPKKHYRRRSRSRSLSPRNKKYSSIARRKYRKSSRNSESPKRQSPDLRSNSPLERKISRRLKKLESLRKASRRRSKSRSSSPKTKLYSSKERKTDFESVRDSKSPKKSVAITSDSPPAKIISEDVKKVSSPTSSVSRQSTSPKRRISPSPVAEQSSTCPPEKSPSSGPVAKQETISESLPKPSSPSSKSPEENTAVRISKSPEKKVLPAVKSRTPSPPAAADTKPSKPEPMDISPTPETKLLKENTQPVLNADFTKLPPVPSLVMQLPPMWSQPPPPGTLPVCDTQTLPPPPFGVQQLPSVSTAQHPFPLQSQQQQQMHSSFGYSHPQGTYQNGSPSFGLPVYSQNNNQNSFQQQLLYGQSSRSQIGCQNFTFPQLPSSSSNPLSHSTQFQNTYVSSVIRQDMSVPPPVYNQSQKYQPNLISHNLVQYPPPAGNHTASYVMQNAQQAQIMQNSQNVPQTQIKINVQQVLHPQNTNTQSLTRTSPYASCRDPRLKDINISVSCETPVPVPAVGTQINTATVSASPTQKLLTSPLPGQPPLPPGQPPLPPGQPPPLPAGQPPLPPGPPPLSPKEMKMDQPPLPKSPPPPSTPPFNKMSKVLQDNPSVSSTAQLQKFSTNIPHSQLTVEKLVPSKAVKNQEMESMTTASSLGQGDSQREKPQEQRPECKTDLNECVCERTGVEKKICLKCLYKKREKLEQASVFLKTPNLCRSVKRPIVVNLLHKRKTQPVTAIVKPNVHEIQTGSLSSEQSHQQETVTTAFNSTTLHSETRMHGSTESVPTLAEQRIDKQCGDILNDKNTVSVQKMSYPGPQTNAMDCNISSNPKDSGISTDVGVYQASVTHKQGNLVCGPEKIVQDDQTHNLETEHHTSKAIKNDEHTPEIKESLKDCVTLKQKDIDHNKVKSTRVPMSTESSFKNKYLTYVITGNKENKKVLTSVISGNVENKIHSAVRRTYRSKSADSMPDSPKQSAKECAKVPKDDLLHEVGTCSLMTGTKVLQNNTPCPIQNTEENRDENKTSVLSSVQQIYQEKSNSTEKSVNKYQISLSEKVEENDSLNNREISAASAEEKSKEIVVKAHVSNNDGNLDKLTPNLNDIHLSEIKLECVSKRPAQDKFLSTVSVKEEPMEIFESSVSVKEEPRESATGDDEKQSKIIGETFTKLNSTGDVDLGSVCSVEKTKCQETQNLSIHLNSDVTVPVTETEHSSSAVCSGEKVGNTDMQYTSFKKESSDSSISMQTDRQSLFIDTEPCTQDERMGTATDSAPVIPEDTFKRPINKDSSCAEGGKGAITAVSDNTVLDILVNVQQPTSLTQNNSKLKDESGLLDNVAPKVIEDLKVVQSVTEKSICQIDEVKQEKLTTNIPVECEEERDNIIRSSLPERAVNISVSDSSDCDIIELPTTIDLCLSDDADDVHEVSVSKKVLPTVVVTNDRPIVLSDPECITIDSSPKKEISQTNIENNNVTPSIISETLMGSNENCKSVTDSKLPVEVLDVTPCVNTKSSSQRKDKPLLQMELEVSSDDSKQQSYNDRDEETSTKSDISKSPPPSKSLITDTLLLQMKPAPRSVKLQQAAILQDKLARDKLCDLNPVEGQNKSTQKIELDRQSAIRDNQTKDAPSFSEKNFKGGSSQNKRNFSDVSAVLAADGRSELITPPNIQQENGEPCLKKRKQSPLVKNDEQTEPNQTVSVRDHPKHAQKSILSVTILQPISIIPSESREGTLSSQVQRYSSRILRSPRKNTVIFAKYTGSTNFNSEEEDFSNEDTTTPQMEKVISKSEKSIKKYPHRSQLPSYAVSRRILISRLRRCPVVLQANLKKMAKLLRQDSKLTQIPLVILDQIDLQSGQNKKIVQNMDLKRLTSRCCCCQVLCRSIATQTDSNLTK